MVNYELRYKIYLYLKVQRNACANLGNSMSDQMGIFRKQNRIQKLSMHSNKISFFITLPPFVAPFNL